MSSASSPTSFDFDWVTKGTITLKGHCWLPEQEPKAIIGLIHGFGEHIGRYQQVAEFFNQHQFGFIGFDLFGHGKSGGKRGYVPDYLVLMENLAEFTSLISQKFSSLPLLLYGHSMGGNLLLNFLLRFQPPFVSGAIVTSPWLRLVQEPPSLKVLAGRIISTVYPQFTDSADLEVNQLSRDPEIGKKYLADPLVHDRMSATLFLGVTEAGLDALRHASEYSYPTLLMHGTADTITSPRASEQFAKLAGNHVEWITWQDARHELHNEINRQEVLEKALSWINELLSPEQKAAK